ncbi:hypothetical protein EHI8A_012280 [Entamoeba histolytica HM-1:IMSS-B]|uniref:CRIB domain-containing protein n=5 Tax=Entamoeba histolytica TaxID=5759 RepID=C4M2L6_ENTH1|nr:hypothetical protein EHI_079950 [Entamoeba histolytica HM-1:IMSS]EMD48744.1 Hypothetical protein EHI5A_032670 [Entamoeba histolytica KU27]EMH75208.1 hypothetical protein EHI8A_012280 [Entamoeba histolytica HM-1:IMSS-B]ENY62464.1 hypothetical protein EHI7A_015050 [Entamoeba histolytica HM-1:IMSS-A]GAT95521.1 hypothetical protein CL6EHI_079950 [Entamoeba histolytica]EAL47490.1 hypothetical protein EHI_079950 [Entamoeba histolytica HM-1:IMSS]|eukprot:XP_652876.1 hypothetical protein EHI_079950 [Entamoeba histolytica HM-1:IMSS]
MSLFRNKHPKEDFENMVISEPTDFRQINHVSVGSDGQVNLDSISPEWKLKLRQAGIRKKDLQDETTRKEIFSLLSENDKQTPSSTHGTLPPPPGRKPLTSSTGKQVPSRKPPAPPNKKLPTPPQGKGKPIPPPKPDNRNVPSHHLPVEPPPVPPPHGQAPSLPPPVPPPRGGAPALPPPRRGTKNAPPPPPPLEPKVVAPVSTVPSGPSLAEQLQAKRNDLNSAPVEDNVPVQQDDDIVSALRGIMVKRREDMNMVDNEEEEEEDDDDWSD